MKEHSTDARYQCAYAEYLADNPSDCRERERRALDHAVALLRRAEAVGSRSREGVEALDFVGRLWDIFIRDLADPENDLPYVLKVDVISIGLWIIKEAALIRCGESTNIGSLIEICAIIRDGLK